MKLLDPLRNYFGIIDMKAKMIHAGGVSRLFRIGGIQDRQVHFTVRDAPSRFWCGTFPLAQKLFYKSPQVFPVDASRSPDAGVLP